LLTFRPNKKLSSWDHSKIKVRFNICSKACNLEITDAEEDDVFCVGEQGSTGRAESKIGF